MIKYEHDHIKTARTMAYNILIFDYYVQCRNKKRKRRMKNAHLVKKHIYRF